jgi:hypothetical protein
MIRKYRALILNDYEQAQYAEWVKTGKKTIETRMNRIFSYRGDLVICCGKSNSVGQNAGKALCIVELYDARAMKDIPAEIEAACIGWDVNRKSHLLRNWRHFSRDFDFAPHATKKNFQGIFEIEIPDDVEIIPRPDIKPFAECVYPNVPLVMPIDARGDKPAGRMFNYEQLVAAAEEKYPDIPLADAINKTLNDLSSSSNDISVSPKIPDDLKCPECFQLIDPGQATCDNCGLELNG